MAQYKIADYVVSPTDEGFQALLAQIYGTDVRPVCTCREPGLPMQIAKIGALYIVKRMPYQGLDHAPECDSYEQPSDLSGRGEVVGSAIVQDDERNATVLKFDFSLAKKSGNPVKPGPASEKSSVRTDGHRLTLRGTLHYLYDEARLNYWIPQFQGKRRYGQFYKLIMQAVAGKESKNKPLANFLYLPEPWSLEKDEESKAKWREKTKDFRTPKGPRELMLLVCEIKSITRAALGGYKLTAYHQPHFDFCMDETLYTRMNKRFGSEIRLNQAVDKSRLIAVATFGVDGNGVPTIEEISVMVTTENWIPFESMDEYELIDKLTKEGRKFSKFLRYNLASDAPMATLVLTDTKPLQTVMFVIPKDPDEDEEFKNRLKELIASRKDRDDKPLDDIWTWVTTKSSMPALPAKG